MTGFMGLSKCHYVLTPLKKKSPACAGLSSFKTACAVYGLICLTLFMNQVQINQRLVTAHRYIGIVFYQAGKRYLSRLELGTQEFHIRAAFCAEKIGIAKRRIDR